MNPVVVTFLGASGPYPGSDDLPSIMVSHGGKVIVLDAGEGLQHRLHEAGKSVGSVDYVFITHLHGDHVLGLIPFLQSRSLASTTKKLVVAGPEGIADYLRSSFMFLRFMPQYDLEVYEVNETEMSFKGFMARTITVDHSVPTVAYRLDFKDVSLCYVTDTRPIPRVSEFCRGVNLLIHDASFSIQDKDLAEEYGHSTAYDAASIAADAGVEMLVLYHISPRYKDKLALLNEARKIFENSFIASKYMKVYLGP